MDGLASVVGRVTLGSPLIIAAGPWSAGEEAELVEEAVGRPVARLHDILDVPKSWRFIGYFCLGYPLYESDTPELDRAGWERRRDAQACVLRR